MTIGDTITLKTKNGKYNCTIKAIISNITLNAKGETLISIKVPEKNVPLKVLQPVILQK